MNYKTILIPAKCPKPDLDYLFSCNKMSAEVWNLCIRLDAKWKELTGKSIGRNDLQKHTKKCVPLAAKAIHHVVHKYLYARDAMWKSRKAKHENSFKVALPYKEKKYFTSGWDGQCLQINYEKRTIRIPRCQEIIDGKNRNQPPVICYVKTIPKNIVEVELVWRGRLMFAIKYKEEKEYLQIKSNNSASIDLGQIHTMTSIDNNGNSIIITGRKMNSILQLRNKEMAKLDAKLAPIKKGSRNYKKLMRTRQKIRMRYKRQMNDCVHKITKLYVDFCLQNDISTVYYGDLDGCTRNIAQNKIGWKTIRQKLNQWNFGQVTKQLENKLTRHGIKMVKVKEYWTSQTCPNCGTLNKTRTRNYSCECGYRQHRDIVGAINILNKEANLNLTKYTTKKYLRIA